MVEPLTLPLILTHFLVVSRVIAKCANSTARVTSSSLFLRSEHLEKHILIHIFHVYTVLLALAKIYDDSIGYSYRS